MPSQTDARRLLNLAPPRSNKSSKQQWQSFAIQGQFTDGPVTALPVIPSLVMCRRRMMRWRIYSESSRRKEEEEEEEEEFI